MRNLIVLALLALLAAAVWWLSTSPPPPLPVPGAPQAIAAAAASELAATALVPVEREVVAAGVHGGGHGEPQVVEVWAGGEPPQEAGAPWRLDVRVVDAAGAPVGGARSPVPCPAACGSALRSCTR